jgi:uncharacterized membrane protein YjjP (DUF1212 family)
MELGRSLLAVGTPAHRLEEALGMVSARLGIRGEFYSTPTALIATFAGEPFPRTFLARSEPGEVNLEKLIALDRATTQVIRGELTPAEGASRLGAIMAAPPRYGPVALLGCYGVSSAALACVFGGGWAQIAAAGAIGLAVGALALLLELAPHFGRIFELAAAMAASFLAHAAARLAGELGPISVYHATATGLIILFPGLTLTTAMTELSTRHLVSGTSRLMGAGVVFLKLAFGVALGGRLGATVFGAPAPAELPGVERWAEAAALLAAALAFTVFFQARPRDAGWILCGSLAAIAGARAGNFLLGPELGPFLGALALTAGSNLYALLLGTPARVVLVPSIVLLVPGSIGFRSVSLLLERDVLAGVNTAFSMVLAAIALAAGVLLANLLVPPRRIL